MEAQDVFIFIVRNLFRKVVPMVETAGVADISFCGGTLSCGRFFT
jgi:hypothetical protein